MLVELRHISGDRLLHRVDLENPPQPGRWLVVEQQSFLVMQRRHRYALRSSLLRIDIPQANSNSTTTKVSQSG